MHVRQLSGYIGALVDGIDLSNLSQTDIDAIKAAYHVHQVLFFREQTLSPDALVNIAKQFEKIQKPHPALKLSPLHPYIFLIETTQNDDISKYNASWHTDVSFDATPPSASLMHAVVVPEVGGDTLYASMYAAYSNLSQRVRDMIEGLTALHDGFSRFRFQLTDPEDHARLKELQEKYPGAVHPVVRRHPQTGRKALYVTRSFTTRIIGLSDVESRNVLSLLLEQAEQSTYQVRWSWQAGDVALWDNRCAMHYAAWDYGSTHRVMHRVTVEGERPS